MSQQTLFQPQGPAEAPLSFQDLPQDLRRKCLFEAITYMPKPRDSNNGKILVDGNMLKSLSQV
jgi:hypothetical protein